MENLNVYLFRFHNNGYFCKTIVLAETYKEAETKLLQTYKEFDVTIEIEEYEEVNEKGVALTECTKL